MAQSPTCVAYSQFVVAYQVSRTCVQPMYGYPQGAQYRYTPTKYSEGVSRQPLVFLHQSLEKPLDWHILWSPRRRKPRACCYSQRSLDQPATSSYLKEIRITVSNNGVPWTTFTTGRKGSPRWGRRGPDFHLSHNHGDRLAYTALETDICW
ncbi:hypothetical protein B0H17DRAFT_1139422 [Mycena rosella]|uniref:Uncharacterized protein n=1 Tax=Mycena rosella TaxID=1033263 RepID=A0AAD7GB54_MYCRO|nr:hypothetical protein B0H17DRAFT_1139422 [Mycena rosella]